MKRAWILLAVVTLVATFALVGGTKNVSCNNVAANTEDVVEAGGPYRNHGQMVRAAAAHLKSVWSDITEQCHDCVMSGFAQRNPNNGSCSFDSGAN